MLERTCIICRQRDVKSNLLRVVRRGDGLVWDRNQRFEGRGAYVHPCQQCVDRIGQRRCWNYALRWEGSQGVPSVALEQLKDQLLSEGNGNSA